jgi:hypothetical protein
MIDITVIGWLYLVRDEFETDTWILSSPKFLYDLQIFSYFAITCIFLVTLLSLTYFELLYSIFSPVKSRQMHSFILSFIFISSTYF